MENQTIPSIRCITLTNKKKKKIKKKYSYLLQFTSSYQFFIVVIFRLNQMLVPSSIFEFLFCNSLVWRFGSIHKMLDKSKCANLFILCQIIYECGVTFLKCRQLDAYKWSELKTYMRIILKFIIIRGFNRMRWLVMSVLN